MNLTEFTKHLERIIGERPDLAAHDMIVRNVQGYEYGADLPEEENQSPPYYLGRIARIDADKYVCSEERVYFASDYDPVETDRMQSVISDVMWEAVDAGKQPDPYELPDDDVLKMYDALPWEDAVVVDIGAAD